MSTNDIPSKTFIIGYGSLMNPGSRNLTGETGQCHPVWVSGLTRVWGVPVPKHPHKDLGWTALSVVAADSPTHRIACVALETPASAIPNFDRREVNYTRVRVDPKQVEFYDKNNMILSDDEKARATFYYYEPKLVMRPTAAFPIMLTYIDVITSGARLISDEFAENFFDGSSGWSVVLDDRANVQYRSYVPSPKEDLLYVDKKLNELNVKRISAHHHTSGRLASSKL
eukprot:PhM_4_TR4847/c0_g1_i1/m.81534